MASVAYDDRSFLIDGQRVWLVSGSVHYFRTPSGLWHDRLLKAKRAGLNCIATYVPWNFHEPAEGRWDFSEDKDVAGFIRLAGELGLYVILRPGPYICAEWDFGGLPGWLTTKPGMAYRTNSAAFTHYLDKYLRQLLPRLADLQVTRGGNIVLIQNENGYYMTAMPDRLAYLEFISQLFRRSGFDIPIITCNQLSDPPVPDSIECVTGRDDAVQQLKRLRLRQPNAPLMVMELYAGRFDAWGGEHHRRDARQTARRAMEVLGCGAQFSYYVWHGGTNFGFWGSRLSASDASYQTTSYDYDAPLAEGGGLTEKYYLTRLVNVLAQSMGPYFAGCAGGAPAISVHDAPTVYNLSGPAGRWAVVSNGGRDETDSVRLSVPSGRELTVPLSPIGAAAVPAELALTPAVTLDYANLTPLGFFGGKVLVLHGPAGWPAELSVNGAELRAEVPDGPQPRVLQHQGLLVVLASTALAQRTWFVDDLLLLGPSFVGATADDVALPAGARQFAVLSMDGALSPRKVGAFGSPAGAPPKLSDWQRISVCTEPVADDLPWRKIERPSDVDRLGVHQGYVWYRLEWDEPKSTRRQLFLPGCEDRSTLYLNGALVGVWGRGDGATRRPIPAALRAGRNVLTILADNLGRANHGWRLGEAKGVFDHLYEAAELRPGKVRLKALDRYPRRIVPRNLSHLIPALDKLRVWDLEMELPLKHLDPVHLSFTDVPHHMAALCNEHFVSFLPCHGRNFGDLTLTAGLKKGRNTLHLLMWGDVAADTAERVSLHSLTECISAAGAWSWRKWEIPAPGGPVVGKDQPAWYVAHFRYSPQDRPLFVHIVGARKGQMFLNGRNVGRFWAIGPQEYYYLPECWLQDDNVLMLFVERGDLPRRTRLEFRPRGPYRD